MTADKPGDSSDKDVSHDVGFQEKLLAKKEVRANVGNVRTPPFLSLSFL
jgi:hypothetical protein